MQMEWSRSRNETVEKHVTECTFQDPLLILQTLHCTPLQEDGLVKGTDILDNMVLTEQPKTNGREKRKNIKFSSNMPGFFIIFICG